MSDEEEDQAQLQPGDTYGIEDGPHGGHTVTVTGREDDTVSVRCSCGAEWSFTDEGEAEDEEHDPETCEDPECYEADEWVVEVTQTVTFTIRAHREGQAQDYAQELADDILTVREPDARGIDNWHEEGTEVMVQNRRARDAERARLNAETARIMAEMEADVDGLAREP